MIKDLKQLGLDEQYRSCYPTMRNRIILFPRIIDLEYIRYLVSLDFICIIGLSNKLYDSPDKGLGAIQLSLELYNALFESGFLIKYKDYLVPLSDSFKNQFIYTYALRGIDD